MREHAGFVAAIAGGLLVIGGVFTTVGVAEAQAKASGGATLDLWGNAWFVVGICAVLFGAIALAASIVMYLRRQGRDEAASDANEATIPADGPRRKISRKERLMPGETLYSPESPTSPDGLFRLSMQTDGNLVAASRDGAPWFASDTPMVDSGNHLVFREDGNLVLCKGTGLVLRESLTAGKGGEELHMQSDGNVVLLGDEGPVWATGGYGSRWRRCPPGTDGCICDTTIPNDELEDHVADHDPHLVRASPLWRAGLGWVRRLLSW